MLQNSIGPRISRQTFVDSIVMEQDSWYNRELKVCCWSCQVKANYVEECHKLTLDSPLPYSVL